MIDWKNISLRDLAGFVSEELRKKGIETILVGGGCVTIYTENRYQSYDLDYVTYEDMRKVRKALKEMGFKEEHGYFKHPLCQWFIEFVSPPVAVGNEAVHNFNKLETPLGTIQLLFPIDCIKDRLASFYHWNDKQSLEQALNLCLSQKIDLSELEKWSLKENKIEKFKIFKEQLAHKSKKNLYD